MRFRTFPWLILLVLGACRGPASREAPGGPVAPRAEVWVDAARWQPGDGTRERPLRSLTEALARPGLGVVHVGAGLYAGPFLLPEGVRVEGVGPSTVLYAEGAGVAVLRTQGGAGLAGLTVQGGGWGLEVTGGSRVRLERVGFRGQREGAVRVESGRLEAEGVRFEASLSETVGVLLRAEAEAVSARRAPPEARIRGSAFTGPFRRAVRVQGAAARAWVEDVRFSDAVTAVGVDSGEAEVWRAVAEGGRGAAFSVVEGALRLEGVQVRGHEYGVSANGAKQLVVRGFTSVRAERAGLGVARSRGVLEDVVVQGSGSYGAVQLTGSDIEVRGLRVDGAEAYGLVAVQGRLKVRGGAITRVRSADGATGEALHLRQLEADVEGVEVRDVAGACVLAAQGARVALRDVALRGCRQGGLVAETLARLEATGVEVRGSGGPALAAFNEGHLSVDALTVHEAAQGLVWTECQGRTRVWLGRVRSEDTRGLSAPCVERGAAASR